MNLGTSGVIALQYGQLEMLYLWEEYWTEPRPNSIAVINNGKCTLNDESKSKKERKKTGESPTVRCV